MSSHSGDFAEVLSEADLRGVRVLVVEESWPTATALEALVDELGMEVVSPAATISDAERLAAGHRPEVAVVDINLRGEMAYALIERLHRQGARVAVVTGYAVLPQATAEIAVILEKPFSTPALRAALCHRPLHSPRACLRAHPLGRAVSADSGTIRAETLQGCVSPASQARSLTR